MSLFQASELKSLNSALPMPLYHQLYALLRQKIESGEIRTGELVPSEIMLSDLFGVSRITAKRALDDLEADRFVERRRGRGTTVSFLYEPKILRAPLNSMLESLNVMGRETSVQVLSVGRVPASKAVADALKIDVGTAVEQAVRVRLNQGDPFAHYVSHTLVMEKTMTAQSMAQQTRLDWFRSQGLIIAHVEQTLSASAATPDVAQALQLSPGAPVLSLYRVYSDQNKRRVDLLQGLYRPDRFQYHIQLSTNERHR
jgi:GntR family transcriptional regulator